MFNEVKTDHLGTIVAWPKVQSFQRVTADIDRPYSAIDRCHVRSPETWMAGTAISYPARSPPVIPCRSALVFLDIRFMILSL
jgi:hypothetical protein